MSSTKQDVTTNLDFGPLVLGGNTFGWTADRDESFRVLDAFVAAGGRAIDTADSYTAWIPGNFGGESETIIGQWVAARRNRSSVLIVTKVFSLPARKGLAPQNVRAAVEDSLRRLQTDYLDVYFAHRDDPNVPQEDYVGVFDELVRAGKVREIGASNFTAARLSSAVSYARSAGLTPFTVSQDHYNMVRRDFEQTMRPTLLEFGIVELPFWSLANGFLTGKYRPGSATQSARSERAIEHLDDPKNVALLGTLDSIAADRRVSVAAVALAWLRQQATVAAPVASARTAEQLPALIESFTLQLTDEEQGRLAL